MAENTDEKNGSNPPGSFGLGRYAWVGNATAMTAIIIAFLWLGKTSLDDAREDRKVFMGELKSLREDAQKAHGDMQKMTGAIEANTRAVYNLARSKNGIE